MVTDCRGVLRSNIDDPKWRQSRRLLHAAIKVFGPGLSRIEHYAQQMSDEFVQTFKASNGKSVDPLETIRNATCGMISLLTFGQKLDKKSEVFQAIKTLTDNVNESFHVGKDGMQLDLWPWLRFFGNNSFRVLKTAANCMDNIWGWYNKEVVPVEDQEMDEALGKPFMKAIRDYNRSCPPEKQLSDADMRANAAQVLFAGVLTTSTSFYNQMLTLMHHPEVKDKMVKEIEDVIGNRSVSINDKPKLPYVTAVINEGMRCVPGGLFVIPHTAVCDSDVLGVKIYKGSPITINMHSLFYDPETYPEPEKFKPERFLDENGQLLPADHPVMRRFTPFGVGPRVCAGQLFAQYRLFLWTVTMYQRFDIVPDPAHPLPSFKVDELAFHGLTATPLPYRARFIAKD
jgi:cytochrome P450